MNNWINEAGSDHTSWLNDQLKAKEHCCEEASLQSHKAYIPCNAPAVNIVGWIGRNDKPIRMCQFCSNHNVSNRGGYVVKPYPSQWPIGSAESLEKDWPSTNSLDAMSEDALLMLWQEKKDAIETAKTAEMDLRKYIVGRAFPQKQEGMNNKELGNGYQLKASVKYNYNLADNDTVESTLEKLSNLGNAGSAISDRLVSWRPHFLLTEFRQLQEDKEKGSKFADDALKIITEMLTISEAAPSLEIKEPKVKKK